ncbi:MAG: glycosyltransferase [Anaerolineales bacterium]|nr:glycosyltransferase [Anaerolineales bacterium]
MLLSILTPSLKERKTKFRQLQSELERQIAYDGLIDSVEHLYLIDNREQSTGQKRNLLIDQARGEFIVFVDDDDDISNDYVATITQTIREHPGIDCVGIRGTITFRGKHPKPFIHSIQYRRFFKQNGIYNRPPFHINPIKRDIAIQYRFERISYSEDMDWAMRIQRDGVLKKEYLIDKPIYFYHSRRLWLYQVFIDRTESIRQALGLQVSNRVRLGRWLREKISQ